jgi:hypothetical protein
MGSPIAIPGPARERFDAHSAIEAPDRSHLAMSAGPNRAAATDRRVGLPEAP